MVTILPITIMSLLSTIVFSLALSIDAFVASMAYGASDIKIPFISCLIIAAVCSGFLGIALLFGSMIKSFMPIYITKIAGFTILFLLGGVKLLDSSIKAYIRKKNTVSKQIHFSLWNLQFIIHIYADPEKADLDASHTLSSKEAASLAIALSLDGLAAGFGGGLASFSVLLTIFISFIMGLFCVLIGSKLGQMLTKKISVDLSWISGIFLIILAFIKYI